LNFDEVFLEHVTNTTETMMKHISVGLECWNRLPTT